MNCRQKDVIQSTKREHNCRWNTDRREQEIKENVIKLR